MRSTPVWLAAGAAVAAAGMAACSTTPAEPPAPAGVHGETVKQVLLDGAELTAMLHQPFTTTTGALQYGGLDQMDDASPPSECVGVTDVAPRSAYASAAVQSYARETWVDAHPGDPDARPLSYQVMFLQEAVVALPSAADAQALFTTFAEQWKRCDGKPANQAPHIPDPDDPPPLRGSEMHITNVGVTDTVLTAFVVMDKHPQAPDTRALGVRGNCIVEVLLPFTGADNPTGSADPKTSPTAVVRALMDRVDKHSVGEHS